MQKKKSRLSRGGREDGTGVKNVTFKNCRRSWRRVTESSAIHTCLSIPANNSQSKAPVSNRWSLLIKGALITRLRDLIPGEGEEKRVSWGLGNEPTVVSPHSLPSKTLKVPANAKTASGENKHLGATTFWRPDSRRAEGNLRVNVSPACMCEAMQKDAENDERYQEREGDRDIKTQPVLCCIRTPGV